MMALPIIYINSWPGAGKYTVARELEKQMDGKVRVVSLVSFFVTHSRFLVIHQRDLIS